MSRLDTPGVRGELASAVAKAVTSSVLGGGPAATILAAATGTAAKGLMASVRAKKLAEAVEELTGMVADRIIAAYRRDPKPGRLGTAESAMHDFRKTLLAADLSMAHLISINLDPKRLARELHKRQPAYLDRYSHRGQIVARACNEFANGIMAMVPALAEFQVCVTRELLKRQEDMVLAVDKLLEERRAERASSADGKDLTAE
jgi:hypothetical protein